MMSNISANVELIVARYNEDLKWTLEHPFNMFKYIVYNKGINEDFEKTHVIQVINLPNVGREGHTYLHHIIEHYDNLSNILVCFPGSVDLPHKKAKAARILNNIIKSDYKKAYFLGIQVQSILKHFTEFKLNDYTVSHSQNLTINNENKLELCKYRPYGKWYKYFFGNSRAKWHTFCGTFSVDKRDIIKHPKNRYNILLQTLTTSSNPEAGHYIERSWGAIFGPLIYTVKVQHN